MNFKAAHGYIRLVSMLALMVVPTVAMRAHADEGLFKPDRISLPKPVRAAIDSVVRIQDKIRFDVTVLSDKKSVKSYSKSHPFKKTFLPDGETIWPVVIDATGLAKACSGAEAYQPGTWKICQSEKCPRLPCHYQTDWLAADATGFVVGRMRNGNLIIATAYHVARESIERDKRTAGVHTFHPAPAPGLTVRLPGKEGNYGPPRPVKLLANASSADWRKGDDWALLAVPNTAKSTIQPLRLAKVRPRPEDPIWVVGFPFRTRRHLPDSARYEDADGGLRISTGIVVPRPEYDRDKSPSDIFTTNDGVAGNSGSPAVNAQGEVVGIFRAHTFYENGVDKRIAKFGGLAQIVDAAMFRDILVTRQVNLGIPARRRSASSPHRPTWR